MGGPIFVIQKHAARNLHYDLRLEIAGVLKSWAVPKGPSMDPRQRRLAVETEDHPLDYAQFEGRIPEDEYGGGTVLIWDTGTYRNLKEDDASPLSMEGSFKAGHIAIWLDGKKLEGGFALIRTGEPEKKQWLLVKMKDEKARPGYDPVRERPESAVTGRTLEQVT